MAFVTVPKDLTRVKNKVLFNLTGRQLICLSVSAALGLPFYFLTREALGTGNAAAVMVLIMLPGFFFALYEKDGLPLEQVIWNVMLVRWIRPPLRRYQVANMFEELLEEGDESLERTAGTEGDRL